MPATRLADPAPLAHVSPVPDTLSVTIPTGVPWWNPQFPTPERLRQVAETFTAIPAWKGEEGPRHRLVLAAGSFRVSAPDLARRERRYEREIHARQTTADQAATYLAAAAEREYRKSVLVLGISEARIKWADVIPMQESQREITEWSRKSRANMVAALCELDYRPLLADPSRVPAMVTLTYPGDWLTVAPDGKTAKRHLFMLRKRYVKAWGTDLHAVWKLEFQDRGAPHFHLLLVPPHGTARIPAARARKVSWIGAGLTFKHWLSAVWADIVDHPDPDERANHQAAGTNVKFSEGLRMTDPKRVAVYFTKHGSFSAKEYQHRVPEPWQAPGKGPGRFWGYWGLQRVTVGVEVTPEEATRAARIARRWARAQGTTREVIVRRTKGGAIRSELAEVIGLAGAQLVAARTPSRRRVRRRVRRLGNGRGFVSVNDGAAYATSIAQSLDVWSRPVHSFHPAEILEHLRDLWTDDDAAKCDLQRRIERQRARRAAGII